MNSMWETVKNKCITNKGTAGALWAHLSAALGEDEAKKTCEDIAMVLATHHLVHSPDLCKALFYHMISVTEDWNSV